MVEPASPAPAPVPAPAELDRLPPVITAPALPAGFKTAVKPKVNRRNLSPWGEQLREREAAAKKHPPGVEEIIAAAADPDSREALLKTIRAEHARWSFAEFFRQAWKVLEPSTELVWNWHLQLMCNVMQAVFLDWLRSKKERGYVNRIRNVLFNLPPGSSKSKVIAVCFQAWAWLHWPGMKSLCLSVNDDATMRDARAMRDLVRSPWYIQSFHVEWTIKIDQDAISSYGNTEGGDRISMPIKSEIVGLRADCLAADTRVATEHGEVTIRELHEHAGRGRPLPRVWSMNARGEIELKPIVATRKVRSRPTVVIRTDADNLIQCTPDHRIWDPQARDYAPATHHLGRRVSVLQRADVSLADRHAPAVPEVPVRDVDVYCMPGGVHAPRCGGGQARTEGEGGAVLQQALLAEVPPGPGEDAAVRGVRDAVRAAGEGARDVFDGMRGDARAFAVGTPGEDVSEVHVVVPTDIHADAVLFDGMCERDALGTDDWGGELELLGPAGEGLRRRSLGESGAADPRARRESLRDLRGDGSVEWAGTACASRRPHPVEQHAGEPAHALRQLPHHTPQVEDATVLSVDDPTCRGRAATVDVFDIDVAGNRNFFAGGVLVHNCILIDDPNNPKKAESKKERDEVNDLWDTNQYNRVNDGMRSLRIGVQQRTNTADWTGHVIDVQGTWSPENPDGWLHVVLPAEFEQERRFVMPDPLVEILRKYLPPEEMIVVDPRKKQGASIDPVRMPAAYLAGERERWKGTGNFAGQMQQRPAMQEGLMVQRQWLNFFRLAGGVREDIDELDTGRPRPAHCHDGTAQTIHGAHMRPGQWEFDWITISLDPASKKTTKGSNWGILVIAGKGGRRYVLDDRTRRGALHEIIDVLKDLIRQWRPDTILVEAKAAGPDVMDTLLEQMADGDLPMITIQESEPGNDDKEFRLDAALPYIKNGMLFLLDGAPWLETFVEELATFPNATRDDRVDSLSQCLNHIREADAVWPDFD